MRKFDSLLRYTKLAPFQLALIRSEEVYWTSRAKMARPILDLGCADGIFGQVLFRGKRGAIAVGVDVDEIALRIAQSKSVYQKIIKADARKLPFADKLFQTVISNQALEHIEELNQALKEINRVLKKKGRFVFLVPTVFLDDYWLTSAPLKALGLNFLANFSHQVRNRVFGHYNLLPVKAWRGKLEKHGFELKTYRYLSSKRRYFISEFFWPLRILQMLSSRLLKKTILFPRGPALFLAQLFKNFLEKGEERKPRRGPTMLIIAQKV